MKPETQLEAFPLPVCSYLYFPPHSLFAELFWKLAGRAARADLTLPVLKAFQLIFVFYHWELRIAKWSLAQELPTPSQY